MPCVEDTELTMGILRHGGPVAALRRPCGGHVAVMAPASRLAMVRKQLQAALSLNAA